MGVTSRSSSYPPSAGAELLHATVLATLTIALAFGALLWAIPSADAAGGDPITPISGTVEEELEEELEEWPECELLDPSIEECEEPEAGEGEDEGLLPTREECLLLTARARLRASTSRDRLQLAIRYTSIVPTRAYVNLSFRTAKGALQLGLAKRRLAKSGVIRVSARLSHSRMEQARGAKRYLVTLDLPDAPAHCHSHNTRRLTIRKSVHGQAVWLQSEPASGRYAR